MHKILYSFLASVHNGKGVSITFFSIKEPALSGGVLRLLSMKSKASFSKGYYALVKFKLEGRELKVTKDYSLSDFFKMT